METNNMEGKRDNSFANNKIGWIVTIFIVVAIIIFLMSMWKGDEPTILVDEGCPAGAAFNLYTGEACPEETANALPEGCEPGYFFSDTTGAPCPQ